MKRRTLVRFSRYYLPVGDSRNPGSGRPAGDGEVLVRIRLADPAADVVRLAAAPLTPLARESAPQEYVLARSGKAGLDWLAASGLGLRGVGH